MDLLRAFDANPIKYSTNLDDSKMASWQYKKLAEQIAEFQDSLDDEHEVGLMLASFGQPVMMQVETIGYQNPYLLYFYGWVKSQKTQLIQHMNQLNFLLIAQKVEDGQPPRRIGFERFEPQTSAEDKA